MSANRGVMALAEGCYVALRNPASHDVFEDLPKVEALEQLAAFSLLARFVEGSEVVAAPPPSFGDEALPRSLAGDLHASATRRTRASRMRSTITDPTGLTETAAGHHTRPRLSRSALQRPPAA